GLEEPVEPLAAREGVHGAIARDFFRDRSQTGVTPPPPGKPNSRRRRTGRRRCLTRGSAWPGRAPRFASRRARKLPPAVAPPCCRRARPRGSAGCDLRTAPARAVAHDDSMIVVAWDVSFLRWATDPRSP